MLNEEQRQRAVAALREYLQAPNVQEEDSELDRNRAALIEDQLKPLVQAYLADKIDLAAFKSNIDGINKRNPFWGFKGVKGQMFFNMVVNVSDEPGECNQEIKAAITVPGNEQMASSRIKTFASYVQRLGNEWVSAGNTGTAVPRWAAFPSFCRTSGRFRTAIPGPCTTPAASTRWST